ncbi:MAG: hypothetical protein HY225_03055, partial [Candidatus Vogelbacteria bacterium]|nr:hypothetical protein [Candidatus Vogelbacteria bacterium]
MSEKIGPVDFGDNGAVSPLTCIKTSSAYSENYAAMLDSEVSRIMNEALRRAQEVLTDHKSALDSMAAELKKVETIERKEFEDLLVLNCIRPKKLEPNAVGATIVG